MNHFESEQQIIISIFIKTQEHFFSKINRMVFVLMKSSHEFFLCMFEGEINMKLCCFSMEYFSDNEKLIVFSHEFTHSDVIPM